MKFESVKHVGMSLLAASLIGAPMSAIPMSARAETAAVQQTGVVKGVVKSETGELLIGAVVFVVGTQNNAMSDVDGSYTLKGVKPGSTIRVQLIGYDRQDVKWEGGTLDFTLKEMNNTFNEAVVTAMGIVRKEKSLTYSTQQIKADEIMKVQDANLVNSIEGKISGVTITPSAGGAGGASKILLRGNKSVLGNNSPLIVVDGIPMTNNTRGRLSDGIPMTSTSVGEGSDPLSQINPDDIESMNILKGANAAALYGSQAANGVVMITTKKGKEGKLSVSFNSNVTFDTPLLTPEIQNEYGAYKSATGELGTSSWGDRLSGSGTHQIWQDAGEKVVMGTLGGNFRQRTIDVYKDGAWSEATVNERKVYLRNYGQDDVEEFYRMGYTTNNSISLSGGTDKIKNYFSYANSHSNGMLENNSYNRNTIALRQNYKFWNRLHIDINANYVQTKTKNRTSGGTVFNPIYHLYVTPRDVDMDYYRDNYVTDNASWLSYENSGFKYNPSMSTDASGNAVGGYEHLSGVKYTLYGSAQNWAYQTARQNNPYFLMNQNTGTVKEDRFYGSAQAKLDIWDGLAIQARVSLDHSKYNSEAYRYATSWGPSSMEDYGRFWIQSERTDEIYTDYLLSYNKEIRDFSVSATAGWVGHLVKGTATGKDITATSKRGDGLLWNENIERPVNYFTASIMGNGDGASHTYSSSWDKAALFTAQLGYKDMVYIDGSYRRDWYRPFKQFAYRGAPDNYGYFGFGANAILSSIFRMPEWISYLKYRLSYSEVGNSIPNIYFSSATYNAITGATSVSGYNSFYPYPEKTKSFETGFESQFFHNALTFDVTYYNSAMHHMYLNIAGTNGKTQPVNTGIIRNQGVEMTLSYNWKINRDWHWKTSVNFSYNHNKIEETYTDADGNSKDIDTKLAGVRILYRKGGSYGDMYVSDYRRWDSDVYKTANGEYTTTYQDGAQLAHKQGDIFIDPVSGKPTIDGTTVSLTDANGGVKVNEGTTYNKYIGNMNSKYQLGWSNTFSYKNFTLYFLINGRIGGKVISLTESYLDNLGLSQRTADARNYALANDITWTDGSLGMYVNEGRDIAPIQGFYETVGNNDPGRYVYDATNFRLRELSLGYTFRDLFGEGKHLSLSFIGRNLFFIYKDAPVDPDISLSTGNGLGAFECFNLPSARSFGANLKINF